MPDHNYFANLIWQIADLLRGPYRPPQYERVMLPMTVLRRFDCVLAPTKARVLAEHAKRKGGKVEGDALDTKLNQLVTAKERVLELLAEKRRALIARAPSHAALICAHGSMTLASPGSRGSRALGS